jgi:hypothetical protein
VQRQFGRRFASAADAAGFLALAWLAAEEDARA